MPRRTLSIAICGAGTAGPAAALLLTEQGHRVTLFERAPNPAPIGAGITLQPTGLSVLKRLGLLERVLQSGARIERLDGRTHGGHIVLDLEYERLHPGLFGLGIHRGALFQILLQALERRGIEIATGIHVESFQDEPERVRVSSSRGQEEFDLLIAADGARSSLRNHHSSAYSVRDYAWGALWAVLPQPPTNHFQTTLAQVFRGTKQFVGALPTGIGPEGSEYPGEPVVSLFWSARRDQMDSIVARGVDAFRRDVLELTRTAHPGAKFRTYMEELVTGLVSTDQLLSARYYDVVMKRPHGRRVVFIGDAAHAMSPQLGQGANLALYDAWILSQCLAESEGAVEAALESYARERRSHVGFYQWATRLLTPLFQSEIALGGVLRDLTMGPLCRWPFFAEQGLGAMAGFKTGVLSSVPVSHRFD